VVDGAVPIGRFLAPDTIIRNYAKADNYCQDIRARLPTKEEL